MKIARIGDAPDIDVEPVKPVSHLTHPGCQSAGNGFERAAVIGRAERFRQPRRTRGENGIRTSRRGALDHHPEKCRGDFRHIAGDHQIPFGGGMSQSRMDAGERSTSRDDIFDHWITKVSISGGITNQSHISGGAVHFACNVFKQRTSFEREQRFVLAHTGAPAASQHKSRAFHAEMITL